MVLACLLLGAASSSFTTKMMGISENLGRALKNVVENADINYTEPNLNVTYVSSTDFNPMGMAHLYNLTNNFVDLVQKKQAYPEGMFRFCLSSVARQSLRSVAEQCFSSLCTKYTHTRMTKMSRNAVDAGRWSFCDNNVATVGMCLYLAVAARFLFGGGQINFLYVCDSNQGRIREFFV